MSFHKNVRTRSVALVASTAAALAFGVGTAGAAVAAPSLAEPFEASTPTAVASNNTLTILGTDGADRVAIANPTGDSSKLLVDFGGAAPAQTFDRASFTAIDVQLGSGDDAFVESPGVVRDETLTVDAGDGNDAVQTGDGNDLVFGGRGNDSILTGNGDDVIFGQSGNDVIDGQVGHDTEFLGSGADVATWNPGEGSDFVDGGSGTDVLQFNGSNAPENMSLSPSGSRAVFLRDVGQIRMDLDNLEHVDVSARGGADTVTFDDMTGTSVRQADVDLAATPGGPGDQAADVVTINGTGGDDHVTVHSHDTRVDVKGLTAKSSISGAETIDKLQINGRGGDDRVAVAQHVSTILGVDVNLGSAN
jgi:Ca2+-binding RTX toxin-like protein